METRQLMFEEDEVANKDLLNRRPLAREIARRLLNVHAKKSFVVGIYGEWGVGKSTLLNFVRDDINFFLNENRNRKIENPYLPDYYNDPIIFEFKPWLFSERQDLIVAFFETLASEIRAAHSWSVSRTFANRLEQYAKLLSPADSMFGLAGYPKIATGLLNLFGGMLGRHSNASLVDVKHEIKNEIIFRRMRLIIIIDDLDRLMPGEIVAILQMVKAVADFPYTIFVLSCDEKQVQHAIASLHGAKAENFLEKIVQVAFRVPKPLEDGRKQYMKQLLWGLDLSLVSIGYSEERFEVFWQAGMSSLLRDIRTIKRVYNSLIFSLEIMKGEVDCIDLWVIESLRLLTPDFYQYVSGIGEYINFNCAQHSGKERKDIMDVWKKECEDVDERFSPREGRLLRTLFPWPRISENFVTLNVIKPFNSVSEPAYFDRYFSLSVPLNMVKEIEFLSLIDDIKANPKDDLKGSRFVFVDFVKAREGVAKDLKRRLGIFLAKVDSGLDKRGLPFSVEVFAFCDYLDREVDLGWNGGRVMPSYDLMGGWIWKKEKSFGQNEGEACLDVLLTAELQRPEWFFTWASSLIALMNSYHFMEEFERMSEAKDLLETELMKVLDSEEMELHRHPNAATGFPMVARALSSTWAAEVLSWPSSVSLVGARVVVVDLADNGFRIAVGHAQWNVCVLEDWEKMMSECFRRWLYDYVVVPLCEIEGVLSKKEVSSLYKCKYALGFGGE
ncbi:hypothetical protein FRC96_02940 [Lujinxingia vulgaris]|uniref:KAP NTPase domain-containing protein n=1 Tax=Lujinxingia vulgaris TaxID=2600176 RepID=A0A5C6XK15_9DELT|nr:P-loop NTPase fold protein [Lujinxingia vulgaris]TXD42639.1 hypothetical protein FRC96_02940 [Lujinxingia vulgaris]